MDEATELKFLRFFYDKAGDAFGPADSDIYRMIRDEFEQEHDVRLGEPYRYDEDEK